MMRHLTFAAAALALAAPGWAAVIHGAGAADTPRLPRYEGRLAQQGAEETETFTSTLKVSGAPAVDLSQISGDVTVVTGSGSEVRIEAIKRARHRDAAEARRLLNALHVDVRQIGDRIEVRTQMPRGSSSRSYSASVDFTIRVPRSGAVAVKTVSGDVAVTGVHGEVRAETVSGDVVVTGTPNLALAKTVSGDVRARDISTATLTLATVSGTVDAQDLKVRTLDCNSVSGDVRLASLDVERLTAKSVTGEIEFAGRLVRGGRYEFNSHSGNVRVLLPGNTMGFELDASSFSGTIRSDFAIALRSFARQDTGGRRSTSRSISGTYGDASAILALRSFSGNVVITKR